MFCFRYRRGIAKEDLPRVFSKFQQFGRTAGPGEKGTGLGLSITKAIVELHKGKIWIDSELGKGTKVTFSLPKYNTQELFKECVTHSLKRLSKEDAALSILVFNLKDISRLKEKIDQEKFLLWSMTSRCWSAAKSAGKPTWWLKTTS